MRKKPCKVAPSLAWMAVSLAAIAGCQTTQSAIKEGTPGSKADPNKLAEAKETLRQVPTINDRIAQDFYQQGLAFEEEGLTEEAANQYLKAIKLKPSFAYQVYTQLGMIYFENEQFDLAVNTFSAAVALNPRSALAYCELGRASAAKGDKSKALDALNQALRINPDFVDAHYQAGKILWQEKKPLAAIHFRRVLELTQDEARIAELQDLLNQLPLQGEPIAAHQTIPPKKAAALFRV